MDTLESMRSFVQVVDAGGFSAAARSLGLPKSTVSRHVSRLEDRLGVRLLNRTTRSLALTDVGRAYYDKSRRIVEDVHEAELGEVTSSGFYVPAIVRGDFCATVRYRICAWQPGDAAVCMGLFAPDQPSGLRYYAMRRSAGARPHEVLANFSNEVFREPVPVEGDEGWLRLERRGDRIVCSHRQGADWTVLGEHGGDAPDDVLFGAKIWSSGHAGPFDAQLFDLKIEGELPDEQLPPVPVRPDPRDA